MCFQNQTQDNLVRLQPGFKKELLQFVEVFVNDVGNYTTNYDTVRHFTVPVGDSLLVNNILSEMTALTC